MVAEKMTMPRTFICWLLPGLILYMTSGAGVSSKYTVRPLGSLSSGTTYTKFGWMVLVGTLRMGIRSVLY